jgi:SAM-dependent methyltransferase
MESSESFGIDFTGVSVELDRLIGAPGDFYRDPMFRGGAIRFTAVQAGAVLRLHALFAEWLRERGRGDDPYQIARLGEIALDAQDCVLWIERAAAIAEQSFYREDPAHTACMVECANMARIAVERRATHTMQLVAAGVGAHGLLQPHRFERILRDLTMYLRQPAPDQALAAVGRASLERETRQPRSTARFWSDDAPVPTLGPAYFDRIYAANDDPWGFATSPYEREKYDTTLRCLPEERYERGLEVGCSIGVLTGRLAERCDALLALDVSEEALAQARRRNAGQLGVEFARMQVPAEMPSGLFDLIVVSEVGYYWQRADLARAATGLAEHHRPGGTLLLVHWTEPVPDYPLTGDQVHDSWLARPEWERLHGERHAQYRIDVLRRR